MLMMLHCEWYWQHVMKSTRWYICNVVLNDKKYFDSSNSWCMVMKCKIFPMERKASLCWNVAIVLKTCITWTVTQMARLTWLESLSLSFIIYICIYIPMFSSFSTVIIFIAHFINPCIYITSNLIYLWTSFDPSCMYVW